MTLPQEASAAPVSEPQAETTDRTPAFADLGLEAAAIFDRKGVFGAIRDALADASDPREIRRITVGILRQAQSDGRTRIAEAFAKSPRASRQAGA